MNTLEFIAAVEFELVTIHGHRPSTAKLCMDGQHEYAMHLLSKGSTVRHVAAELSSIINDYITKYDYVRQG